MLSFLISLIVCVSSLFNTVPNSDIPSVDPYSITYNYNENLSYDEFEIAMDNCDYVNNGDPAFTQNCMILLANTYPTYGFDFFNDMTLRMGYTNSIANRFYTFQDTYVDPGYSPEFH